MPFRLASACCKVLQHTTSSSCSIQHQHQQKGHSLQAHAHVLSVLQELVLSWQKDKVIVLTQGPSKLAASFGQQLQKAGFLDLLPELLTDTADRLAAVTPAPRIYATSQPSAAPGQDTAADGIHVQSSSTARSMPYSEHDSKQLGQEALALMCIYSGLAVCWGQEVFAGQIAPACSVTVVRLVCRTAQHISAVTTTDTAYQQERPVGKARDLFCLASIWSMAQRAARIALKPAVFEEAPDPDSSELQQQLPLMRSPHYLPCICLLLVCAAYTSLLLQLPNLPRPRSDSSMHSNTTTSSSSANSTNDSFPNLPLSTPLDAVGLWQFACSEQPSLPASHRMLQQLLRWDSKAVVWLSVVSTAEALEHPARDRTEQAVAAYNELGLLLSQYMQLDELRPLLMPPVAATAGGPSLLTMGGSDPGQPGLAWKQEQHLHYLLPSVLLFWAAHQPVANAPGADITVALASSKSALLTARHDLGQDYFYQQLLRQQEQGGELQEQDYKQTLPVDLQLMVTGELLCLAALIAPRLTLLMRPEGSGDDASALSSASGNSSTGSMDMTALRAAAASRIARRHALECSRLLLRFLATLAVASNMHFATHAQLMRQAQQAQASEAGAATAAAADTNSMWSRPGIYAPAEAVAAWAPHVVTVTRLLEAVVRCSIEQGGEALATLHRFSTPFNSLCLPTPGCSMGPLLQVAVSADPACADYQEQQLLQLFSLMCSLLNTGSPQWIEACIYTLQAVFMLLPAAEHAADTPPADDDAVTKAAGANSASHDGDQSAGGGYCPPASTRRSLDAAWRCVLPWCVLGGRVCLMVGQLVRASSRQQPQEQEHHTEHTPAAAGSGADTGALEGQQSAGADTDSSERERASSTSMLLVSASILRLLAGCGSVCEHICSWLQAGQGAMMNSLTAEGFDVSNLPSQLLATAAVLESVNNPTSQASSAASSADSSTAAAAATADVAGVASVSSSVPHLLQAVGLALTSLAIPYACNNSLSCSATMGPSELQLVNGRSCVCSGCRVVRFCSRPCLRQHWPQHKPVCKSLAAAKAAKAGR